MKNMMKRFKSIILLSAIISVVFFANCGDDGDEVVLTEQQIATQSLVDGSPWTINNVTSKPDPSINTSELENLVVTFDASGSGTEIMPAGFTASGAPNFIATQSGATWSWSGDAISTITLNNVNISQLTSVTFAPDVENPTTLTVSFNISDTGGRIQGIVGNYTVELSAAQ